MPDFSEAYAVVGMVQMLLRTGTALGMSREEMLTAAGLTEADLADRDARISYVHQARLGKAIVVRNRGVNIGLVASAQLSLPSLGLLGHVAAHTATLGEFIKLFCRYQDLLTNLVQWAFRGTTVRLHTDMIGPAPEVMMLAFVRLGRQLTGEAWSPQQVCVRHPPLGDPQEYIEQLGFPLTFRAPEYRMVLPSACLSLPIQQANPTLLSGLIPLLETARPTTQSPPIVGRLRIALDRYLPQGETARQFYAEQLGVSERTLNRRLTEAGTSFRDVLDERRRSSAERLLRDSEHSIGEIAWALGYAEPSTLHRHFKRWHGCSPRAWRRTNA